MIGISIFRAQRVSSVLRVVRVGAGAKWRWKPQHRHKTTVTDIRTVSVNMEAKNAEDDAKEIPSIATPSRSPPETYQGPSVADSSSVLEWECPAARFGKRIWCVTNGDFA